MNKAVNVVDWNRYISINFVASKLRERGFIWCAIRFIKIIWQIIPSVIRAPIIIFLKYIIIITCFPVSVLFYLVGIRILVNCRTYGMGHLAIEPAWFLVKNEIIKIKRKKGYILLVDRDIANDCLYELLRKYLFIYRSRSINKLLTYLAGFCYITIDIGAAPPISTPHDINFTRKRNIRHYKMMTDIQNYRYKYQKRILDFPDELLKKGLRNLEILGISENDWFVCLHAGEVSINGKYGYELFRRQLITDFYGVIEYIDKRGGKIVRMGDRDLPEISDKVAIIDYPHSKVNCDWMDLFLISECRYFIGCQTGLQMVAVIFGKPQIITNIIPWHMVTGFNGDIYLPKMIKSRKTGDFISISKYMENDLHYAQWDFPESFIAIPNEAEDLITAVDEMEFYLSNQEKLTEPDRLQVLWKESFPEGSQCLCSDVRISASFVNKYKDILFKS